MPYILVHGLGQTAASWDQVVREMGLSEQSLCPDLPRLLQGNEPTYEGLYKAFCNYCETVPGMFHLCGLSLGAILALHYTIEHPDRVQSLVLIGGHCKMPKTLLKMQSVVFRCLPKSAFAQTGFEKKDLLRVTASMAELDFSSRLQEISCPTLVLCGQKDKANQKAAMEMGQAIPKAQWLLVADAGHEVNVHVPQKLAQMLRQFYLDCENR